MHLACLSRAVVGSLEDTETIIGVNEWERVNHLTQRGVYILYVALLDTVAIAQRKKMQRTETILTSRTYHMLEVHPIMSTTLSFSCKPNVGNEDVRVTFDMFAIMTQVYRSDRLS